MQKLFLYIVQKLFLYKVQTVVDQQIRPDLPAVLFRISIFVMEGPASGNTIKAMPIVFEALFFAKNENIEYLGFFLRSNSIIFKGLSISIYSSSTLPLKGKCPCTFHKWPISSISITFFCACQNASFRLLYTRILEAKYHQKDTIAPSCNMTILRFH